MLVSRAPAMESVQTESWRRGTPRTPSWGRTVWVVVLVLAVAVGEELVHENLHRQDGKHRNKANATDVVPSTGQRFAAEYFKCRCTGNQVWDDSRCRDKQTNVSVLLPDTQSVVVALTDDFAGVTVRDVQCPENYAKVHLDPNRSPSHQFTLLANGLLSWQQREYEHYCLEHTIDAHGHGQLTWEANVCLPPPSVPRCCFRSMTPSADGLSCSDRLAQPFLPPLSIGEDFTEWPKVVSTTGRNCSALETSLDLPLNTGKSNLLYESGEVFLEWKTDHHLKKKQRDGFCVMPQEGSYVATVCYEDHEVIRSTLCEDATCVLKCCPEGDIHGMAMECVRAENKTQLWKPSFVEADNLSNVPPPKDLKVWHGRPQCPMYQANPQIDAKDTFFLLENGFLFTPAATEKSDPPMRYCVDNFLNSDNTVSTKALICFEEEVVAPVCSTAKSTLFPALLLVSTAFLGLTLVIYLSMQDLRNKLHGRCLISLTSAFFVSYLLMAITSLSDLSDSTACIVLAFFKHLGLLAAFFWLNVMCFDIWRALRKTRVIQSGRWAVRRFLLYSLYAWGCALVIAVVAMVVELLPDSYDVIRPKFQNDSCWFSESKSLWIYFYLWLSLVVVANIIFFGLVVVILVKGQNNSLLRRSREANRERMWLYVKLFLVMGVTWMAEMLSYQTGKCVEWLFTDIINCLQGLTLFLVFIFSRSTLRKLKEEWCCGRPHRALSPSNTYTSSISSTTVSKKFSNTSSNFKDFNAESGIPMKTLSEVPEESSCLKPPQNSHESTEKEKELLSLKNGDAE